MLRKIIQIDESKCDGCGLCASACHEGAIGMVEGKARLLREDYCDGLGDCLPACPQGAITFVEREAAAYDHAAVQAAKAQGQASLACGCPGSQARTLAPAEELPAAGVSQLRQWPVQLRLVPAQAPYFQGADLLVAADCAAYAHGNFHRDFLRGRVALIGCPKLDDADYAKKLEEILRRNDIRSLTVARMEVPCCGGLQRAAAQALQSSGKHIPFRVITLSTDGRVLAG